MREQFHNFKDALVTRPADAPIIWRPSVYVFVVHEVTADEAYLLLMKNRGRHAWEVPGGGQDPGEEMAKAGARELKEETGYVVGFDEQPFCLIERFYTINEDSKIEYCHGHVMAFAAVLAEKPSQDPDIAQLIKEDLHPETAKMAWVDLRRIKRSDVFPAYHKLFAAFYRTHPHITTHKHGGWT